MKKCSLFFLLFFCFAINVCAKTKEEVKFKSCVDGDTIKVIINNKEEKVRFLAIDTPETKHPNKKKEPYGEEASNFTCEKVRNAKKLELEYDKNSDKRDKYNRVLAWVWADDQLLEKELIQKGYAKVAYLYGSYKYTHMLKGEESIAIKNRIGIWSENKEEETSSIYLIIGTILFITYLCFSTNYRNETKKKAKSKIKKILKRSIK